ncbi:hypothetical protein DH2020_008620 [Rehmannia glutinosa]|uniref:Retrotransposon Copia-like N-terminal domain-containing protein n=1 Tax=Rehmannia glutinosa TaxID=99300 RepID=A0ABR0X3Y0_REHGL
MASASTSSSPSSISSIILPNFTTLTIRFDRSNYVFWRAQLLATTRAHGFDGFLNGTAFPPPQLISEVASTSLDSIFNPEYILWLRKDQFLFSWLLSSISESMLGHITRCTTSAKIWSVLANLFQNQSRSRIMHLRLLLQTTKKADSSIDDYLLKMQGIADQLQAAGQNISDDDLILYVSWFGY